MAAAPAFTVSARVANGQEIPADASWGKAASVTTRVILATLTKQVRNVTADTTGNGGVPRFGSQNEGTAGQVLEYCILTQNRAAWTWPTS